MLSPFTYLLVTFLLHRLLPCGIIAPPHVGPPLGTAAVPSEDKLFSASQRYTYFQEKPVPAEVSPLTLKRDIRPPARYKNARMTVRLRPRQVLCSKCRGICNENSENVDGASKKRKATETESRPVALEAKNTRKLRSSGTSAPSYTLPTPSKRLSQSQVPQAKRKKPILPKLAKEPENGVSERVQKLKIVGNYWLNQDEEVSIDAPGFEEGVEGKLSVIPEEEDPLLLPLEDCLTTVGNVKEDQTDGFDDPLDISENNQPRVLRKKRSVGSMEDLWDENVFEDALKAGEKKLGKAKTPVIKISFGSGTGAGTVVEIPAKSQDIPSESETDEKMREKTKRDASAKAAKKALKKAKKEARRKMVEAASPARSLGGTSPRYANLSPRYFTSYMSPRPNMDSNSQVNEILYKKHKHKVKHKKKHKEEKKHRDEENEENDECIRECLKQKLSINLKRLNANAYMSRASSSSSSISDTSDEQSDAVPGLPDSPPMARHSNQDITSCQTSEGRLMAVGDVVWGKIHGFPWWPGKVQSTLFARPFFFFFK